jgi:hypothetical protein
MPSFHLVWAGKPIQARVQFEVIADSREDAARLALAAIESFPIRIAASGNTAELTLANPGEVMVDTWSKSPLSRIFFAVHVVASV